MATINKTIKVIVCDKCGGEEDNSIKKFIYKCAVCGADLCTECCHLVRIDPPGIESRKISYRVCPEHIKELLARPSLKKGAIIRKVGLNFSP